LAIGETVSPSTAVTVVGKVLATNCTHRPLNEVVVTLPAMNEHL
jgi:hypothetical protein